jgi:hypothetical protein
VRRNFPEGVSGDFKVLSRAVEDMSLGPLGHFS